MPGEKGSMSAMILKKTLLRYCMLSWTILMGKISPIIKEKYTNTDALIVKGLVTTSEIKKLYKNDDDLVWWIPFEWSMLLINKEMNEKGHVPRFSYGKRPQLGSWVCYPKEIVPILLGKEKLYCMH